MTDSERTPVLLICKTPSLTKQSFKDECDVNRIMKRYRKTGELIHVNVSEGRYGDFSTDLDYQAALHAVRDAQADFDDLPSEIRRTMNNDPAELLRFINDPDNHDQAVELGLLPRPAAGPSTPVDLPTPAEPPVASPPASPIAGGE